MGGVEQRLLWVQRLLLKLPALLEALLLLLLLLHQHLHQHLRCCLVESASRSTGECVGQW